MDNDTISLDSAASTFSEGKAGNHYSPDAAQKIVTVLSEVLYMQQLILDKSIFYFELDRIDAYTEEFSMGGKLYPENKACVLSITANARKYIEQGKIAHVLCAIFLAGQEASVFSEEGLERGIKTSKLIIKAIENEDDKCNKFSGLKLKQVVQNKNKTLVLEVAIELWKININENIDKIKMGEMIAKSFKSEIINYENRLRKQIEECEEKIKNLQSATKIKLCKIWEAKKSKLEKKLKDPYFKARKANIPAAVTVTKYIYAAKIGPNQTKKSRQKSQNKK